MKQIAVGKGALQVPAIALGCMRMANISADQAEELILAAVENGITFFDHADIYGGGRSEEIFGEVLARHPGLRDKMQIQSKCGICSGYFDFSKEHIVEAAEGSLRRLGVDYLDVLLLHRPDTLMEPEEVADAFDTLHRQGKVRYFGVSNQNPMQMELLSGALDQPLLFNQLQFGPLFTGMVDSGLNVNMTNPASVMHDGGLLEYCRLRHVTIQPWSPFQFGFFGGVFLGNEKFPELNQGARGNGGGEGNHPHRAGHRVDPPAPGAYAAIAGTMKVKRLLEIASAAEVELTRQEWYAIYRAAGNVLP